MDEDLKLIDRIREGDDSAFAALLKRHHRMIYKIINSIALENGDYAVDKDDLYQEASLALLVPPGPTSKTGKFCLPPMPSWSSAADS